MKHSCTIVSIGLVLSALDAQFAVDLGREVLVAVVALLCAKAMDKDGSEPPAAS